MNTKEQIIKKINAIDDPELLHEVEKWIHSLIEVSEEENFSPKVIDAVEEGYKQYTAGDIFTQEQADKLLNEWRKGK